MGARASFVHQSFEAAGRYARAVFARHRVRHRRGAALNRLGLKRLSDAHQSWGNEAPRALRSGRSRAGLSEMEPLRELSNLIARHAAPAPRGTWSSDLLGLMFGTASYIPEPTHHVYLPMVRRVADQTEACFTAGALDRPQTYEATGLRRPHRGGRSGNSSDTRRGSAGRARAWS